MTGPIIHKHSTHHGERADSAAPTFLIIHYTESANAVAPDGYFTGTLTHPTGGCVSAHYMIDVDGSTVQYVDEDRRAWHAGASHWAGVADINTHSIGIELVNGGPAFGYTDFPPLQIDALIALAQGILTRHNIPLHHVLAHSDIAPGRKIDPGEKFPWKILADAGVGLWPQPIQSDFNDAAALMQDDAKLKQSLVDYGYDPVQSLDVLVKEFQRHFQPEAFAQPQSFAGVANTETALRLSALLRQKLNP